MSDYYKKTWTEPNNHGTIFWKNVDFSKKEYKIQEHAFRQLLKSLKSLYNLYKPKREIKKIYEAGAGTGRMSKIILEEFPDFEYYSVLDIREKPQFFIDNPKIKYIKSDLLELLETGDAYTHGDWEDMGYYDLILASEIFMHIKPEDISRTIELLSHLLAPNGIIINIDWFYEQNALSEWCFIHDYDKMYRENGLTPIFTADMKEIKQKMFCYGK